MLECLRLARQGKGYVSPNPLVGALVVRNGKIIGRGYHAYFGGPHAEVNALRSADHVVHGGTLYTTLEPCNHFGKTPPCTELIVRSRIGRVVVGMLDPNPLIAGKGISALKKKGVRVTSGVLERQCRDINEMYSTFVRTGLPFVTLKIAQTLDGRIADQSGTSRWITNTLSRTFVHSLRSEYDAVLVGANTVREDDPRLTVRLVEGRNPLRVVLDGRFRCDPASRIFSVSPAMRTVVVTSQQFADSHKIKKQALMRRGVRIIELRSSPQSGGRLPLKNVLKALAVMGVASVLVEGGASIFSGLMGERLVDKVICCIAPRIYGRGLNSFEKSGAGLASLRLHRIVCHQFDEDILIEGNVQYH